MQRSRDLASFTPRVAAVGGGITLRDRDTFPASSDWRRGGMELDPPMPSNLPVRVHSLSHAKRKGRKKITDKICVISTEQRAARSVYVSIVLKSETYEKLEYFSLFCKRILTGLQLHFRKNEKKEPG